MRLIRLDIMIFAMGLLLLVSNSKAESKNYHLIIQDKSPIDLCGNKEVIIAPYMGLIVKSDDVVGYEISISYNPEVVRMNRKLFIGTISNYFSDKTIDFFPETNEIVFEGIVSLKGNPTPVAGDLPLFAVAGDFIGECNDVAEFKINYYKFYDFKGTIDSTSSLDILGNIADKPSREIGYNITDIERSIIKDSTLIVEVELELGELSSLEYWKSKITVDTDSISVESIDGSNSIEIIDVTKEGDNSYLVDFKVLNEDNPKLFIETKSHKIDSTNINFVLETIETTECICATRFPSNSFSITNKETETQDTTTTSNIVDTYSDRYDFINDMIIPKTEPLDIELYNINGVLIEKKHCNVNERYNTKQNRLGVYFIKVTSKDITRIIKIINN